MRGKFLERLSRNVARWTATSCGFIAAFVTILLWFLTGIFFSFSNSWQFSFNTFLSLLTFLMLFLMQRSDKKELQAVQLKLDELISTQKNASDSLINIENSTEEEIESVQKKHERR